jgi:hypothetical protein
VSLAPIHLCKYTYCVVSSPLPQVLDFLAHVTIRQRYRNLGDTTINCEYVFPVDDKAAVNRLVITVGDRVIEGEVQERGAAKATYVCRACVGCAPTQPSCPPAPHTQALSCSFSSTTLAPVGEGGGGAACVGGPWPHIRPALCAWQ